MSVSLVRNGQSKFLENLNVVVTQQQMPMTDATAKKLLDVLPKQYQASGLKVEKLEANLREFGKNEAVVLKKPSFPEWGRL